jgi:hypothetical protein
MLSRWGPDGFVDTLRSKADKMHPLVRAACVASIPAFLSERHERKLLTDLTSLYPAPPDGEVIEAHVRNLDSDRFHTREQSAAELRKIGHSALGLLRAEAAKPRSAESIERLKAVISAIEKADRAENQPLEVGVLKHLQEAKTNRADAMLDAIAAAKSDAWIVREARAIRDRGR